VSLSSENMMKLMAYADGELEGADLAEAQRLLATDPDSVRFVEQIAGLGDVVTRGYEEGTGKTVARFDAADSVMALTKSETKSEGKGNVSSLAAARAKRGDPRVKIGAGIAAALALAASLFLFAQHRTDESPMASNTPPAAPAAQTVAANPTVAAVSTSGTGVSVSTVNSPGNAVSVFYLPTANELSTSVVVWVDETGEK
jgi:hypothetical protein